MIIHQIATIAHQPDPLRQLPPQHSLLAVDPGEGGVVDEIPFRGSQRMAVLHHQNHVSAAP
jgi:hypothetical protein